ncbi:MAG: hypothetical protein V1901_04385 [Patescibacteria group bacterium]
MEDKNISLRILTICRKLGIDYNSPSINANFINDAGRLGDIYIDLKSIAAEILEISERHNLEGLGQLLLDDIEILEKIDHDILKVARKLK